jgi:hypothetical protein
LTRWITKNGRHIPIPTKRYVREVDIQQKQDFSYTQPITTHRFLQPKVSQKHSVKPEKKWYEEGWRTELYRFSDTNYAIDFGNFGNSNFSFVVRNGDKEIFTVPKYLIKNAISFGLTSMMGVPGCPTDVPIAAIKYAIDLYDQRAS